MDQRLRGELDNYITGHYGEDQFRDDPNCKGCGEPRSVHGEEPPYDLPETECEGFRV